MKNILLTGASTGIGKATAVAFGKLGCHVLLVARRQAKLEETRELIERTGGTADIFVCDLSKTEQVNRLIEFVRSKVEELHAIINIAAIWHGENTVYANTNFESFDQQIILDTIAVGVTAPMLLVHSLLQLMPEHSRVVNVSGTFENGAKGWLPYYVSKKAIEEFTMGLSEELERKNIQVNCVSPADTATEEYKKYFPQYIHEAVLPEQVAERIVYYASEATDELTGHIEIVKK